MNKIFILFICFFCSLGMVLYEDKTDVLVGNNDSVYVFNDVDNNIDEISNPNTSDLNLNVGFVVLFYSLLFGLAFFIKLRMCQRYKF